MRQSRYLEPVILRERAITQATNTVAKLPDEIGSPYYGRRPMVITSTGPTEAAAATRPLAGPSAAAVAIYPHGVTPSRPPPLPLSKAFLFPPMGVQRL